MTPRPAFLSFDGVDGTGKSTQVRRLADWLRGHGVPVTACADPGGTDLGAKLREILLFGRSTRIGTRTEALLFMASRAELVEQVIRPALDRGEVVLSDRFALANVVYQGHAGGLDPAELWAVSDVATGGLRPDRTLLFDLDAAAAQARRGRTADRMEARGTDYLERVRRGFLAERAADPDRIRLVDAGPDAETVFRAVLREAVPPLVERGWPLPPG
jgi:dTMP kinase